MVVEGEREWISAIRGVSLEGERAVRIRVEGKPRARESAVSAPIERGEGPVMRTVKRDVSLC